MSGTPKGRVARIASCLCNGLTSEWIWIQCKDSFFAQTYQPDKYQACSHGCWMLSCHIMRRTVALVAFSFFCSLFYSDVHTHVPRMHKVTRMQLKKTSIYRSKFGLISLWLADKVGLLICALLGMAEIVMGFERDSLAWDVNRLPTESSQEIFSIFPPLDFTSHNCQKLRVVFASIIWFIWIVPIPRIPLYFAFTMRSEILATSVRYNRGWGL